MRVICISSSHTRFPLTVTLTVILSLSSAASLIRSASSANLVSPNVRQPIDTSSRQEESFTSVSYDCHLLLLFRISPRLMPVTSHRGLSFLPSFSLSSLNCAFSSSGQNSLQLSEILLLPLSLHLHVFLHLAFLGSGANLPFLSL